jgi:hypothetical protein
MQAQGAGRQGGVGTIPRRGGRRLLEALLAVAAILITVALMALMTRGVVAPGMGEVGAKDAKAGAAAGTTVVHDDAGSMPFRVGTAVVHDDAGNMPATGTGAAVVHDDAGNVR